jgi:glycosyltransferase involved in cell wall biosynthesis
MKVILLNTSERTGGAAIAANRLMKALIDNGIEAKTLVLNKQTDDENVISIQSSFFKRQLARLNFLWERLGIFVHNRFSRENLFKVSIANTGFDVSKHPSVKEADIIHIHWINQGFLSLSGLQKLFNSGKPVFCTMHDMWFFTGICHHARECNLYQTHCHDCFYLNKPGSHDLSNRVFKQKKELYQSGKITFIACSRWMQSCAGKSALLSGQKIIAVPNPIDTTLFHPMDQSLCRKNLNLPVDKKLILFGAVKISDERKGIHYLNKAIDFLSQATGTSHLELVIFGKSDMDLSKFFALKVNYVNYLSDEKDIIALYNAADVYVTPSLDENLPNTIMEAMACGTPCVGFKTGGIPEMIDHQQNGYVAKYEDPDDFAKGILWCLENYRLLSTDARKKVEKCYSNEVVAKQYINLYQPFF